MAFPVTCPNRSQPMDESAQEQPAKVAPLQALLGLGLALGLLVGLWAALSGLVYLLGQTAFAAWELPWSFSVAASLTLVVQVLLLPCYALLCSLRARTRPETGDG